MIQAIRSSHNLDSSPTSILSNGREWDLSITLTTLLQRALSDTRGVRGSVVLVDPSRNELVIFAKIDPDDPWPPAAEKKVRLNFRVGEGIAGYVAQNGSSHNAPIASEDKNFVRPALRPLGTWSLMAVPIISHRDMEHRILGVISVEGPEGQAGFFDKQAIEGVEALAVEAATSIEKAMWPALAQFALSSYRLRRIQAVSQVLVSGQSYDQTMRQISQIAFEELRADLLTLYEWDVDKGILKTPPMLLGKFNNPIALRHGIHEGDVVHKVFYEWGSKFFEDAQHDPDLDALGRVPARDGEDERERFAVRENVASAAILRLNMGVKRVGVLCVNWHDPHPFDEGEKVVLEIFANQVAIAIETDRLVRLAVGQAADAQGERLSRDLHDSVANRLSAIHENAIACKGYLDQGRKKELEAAFDSIYRIAADAHKGARALMEELHPSRQRDLPGDLRQLCVAPHGDCQINVKIEGPADQVRKEIAENVYQIAQEAIINAMRHGMASLINVILSVSREQLNLEVVDNGKGGELLPADERKLKNKYGLSIMEGRAFLLKGELKMGPTVYSQGWFVSLQVGSPLA